MDEWEDGLDHLVSGLFFSLVLCFFPSKIFENCDKMNDGGQRGRLRKEVENVRVKCVVGIEVRVCVLGVTIRYGDQTE